MSRRPKTNSPAKASAALTAPKGPQPTPGERKLAELTGLRVDGLRRIGQRAALRRYRYGVEIRDAVDLVTALLLQEAGALDLLPEVDPRGKSTAPPSGPRIKGFGG